MKRFTPYLFAMLLGVSLGAARLAWAVDSPTAAYSTSTYVNPAFAAPKAPQKCGTDGGAGCVLTFSAGACLRVATMGTWQYQVGSFDLFPDGGTVVNLATCALYTLADGGAATYSDGGCGPYTDGGVCLGGVISFPQMVPLTDDKVEGFCFNRSQTKLSACTVDGGILSVSERYP